jgi:hypothetical protein
MCDEGFVNALIYFLSWVPEGMWASPQMAATFKWSSEEHEDMCDFQKQPFFGSQAWSYLIWHKEDARSFHAAIDNMIRAAGFDPYQLKLDLAQKRKQEESEQKELEDLRAKRKMDKQNGS